MLKKMKDGQRKNCFVPPWARARSFPSSFRVLTSIGENLQLRPVTRSWCSFLEANAQQKTTWARSAGRKSKLDRWANGSFFPLAPKLYMYSRWRVNEKSTCTKFGANFTTLLFLFSVSLFFCVAALIDNAQVRSAHQTAPALIWWDYFYTSRRLSLFLLVILFLQSFSTLFICFVLVESYITRRCPADQPQGRTGRGRRVNQLWHKLHGGEGFHLMLFDKSF